MDRETGRVFERLAEPGSPVTLSGGERLFAVKRCGDRVHDGGDAHRLLDRFLRDTACFSAWSCASMQAPQPLIADTANDHSSKSLLSTPGWATTLIRSRAGIVL